MNKLSILLFLCALSIGIGTIGIVADNELPIVKKNRWESIKTFLRRETAIFRRASCDLVVPISTGVLSVMASRGTFNVINSCDSLQSIEQAKPVLGVIAAAYVWYIVHRTGKLVSELLFDQKDDGTIDGFATSVSFWTAIVYYYA